MEDHDYYAGQTYNIDGGEKVRVPLLELNVLYREIIGNWVPIAPVLEDRRETFLGESAIAAKFGSTAADSRRFPCEKLWWKSQLGSITTARFCAAMLGWRHPTGRPRYFNHLTNTRLQICLSRLNRCSLRARPSSARMENWLHSAFSE